MIDWIESLSNGITQCWSCGIFDELFTIVSTVGFSLYESFSKICIALFGILFFIFTLNALWHNFKDGIPDPFMKESFLKVFIRSIIALTLLASGAIIPKVISMTIFEPVAKITLEFSLAITNKTVEELTGNEESTTVAESITNVTTQNEGEQERIFSTKLRDDIILIMKTTISQFQQFIMLGLTIMDKAFSWSAFTGIGIFFKHILLFFIGLYLAWNFLKLFFKYCCYFADVIIAMAFFAFFFPISLIMVIFKDVKEAPKWFGNIGKNIGAAQIKIMINAIVTLGSAVLTYTVIMTIIASFLTAKGVSVNDLIDKIQDGLLYADNLSTDTLYSLTLASFVALMYVLNYIFQQIPQITKTVMSTFGVEENAKYSEELANDISTLVGLTKKNTVDTAAAFAEKKKKADESDGKKDDK